MKKVLFTKHQKAQRKGYSLFSNTNNPKTPFNSGILENSYKTYIHYLTMERRVIIGVFVAVLLVSSLVAATSVSAENPLESILGQILTQLQIISEKE